MVKLARLVNKLGLSRLRCMFLILSDIHKVMSPHYCGHFLLDVYNANQCGALAPAF
jgi:hypothetical protein